MNTRAAECIKIGTRVFLGLGIHFWSRKYPKMSPSGCKSILKKFHAHALTTNMRMLANVWKKIFCQCCSTVYSIYFAKMRVFYLLLISTKNIKVSVKSWNAEKPTFHNTHIYCLTADLPITSDSKLTFLINFEVARCNSSLIMPLLLL